MSRKMEFYFKRKDLLKLLEENPHAKGIIIRRELNPKKTAKSKGVSTISITAYAHQEIASRAIIDTDVPGCPYPPGCVDDEEVE
ncbi:MAG: hypothetical protein ACK5NK_03825 [Niabella sp.]